MCISMNFGINLGKTGLNEFTEKINTLGQSYDYGIGIGVENLMPGLQQVIFQTLSEPQVVFEVHDPPEPHCACDIDDDIRIAAKLGKTGRFFDFVRELAEEGMVKSLKLLIFQEIVPGENNVRRQAGTYEDFVELLNRWNTWQVDGFEPIRRSYFIKDSSPLLFTFTLG